MMTFLACQQYEHQLLCPSLSLSRNFRNDVSRSSCSCKRVCLRLMLASCNVAVFLKLSSNLCSCFLSFSTPVFQMFTSVLFRHSATRDAISATVVCAASSSSSTFSGASLCMSINGCRKGSKLHSLNIASHDCTKRVNSNFTSLTLSGCSFDNVRNRSMNLVKSFFRDASVRSAKPAFESALLRRVASKSPIISSNNFCTSPLFALSSRFL
mmetsp:Transcript_44203/g.102081  ORF Transcript_44203/g.102081 Transcript_44203/m.102081 type:complete len:211 (+) Transcript_44203:1352-1984(+)